MKEKLTGTVINPDVVRGKSAYEIAVMNGFDGTESEWLASLKGKSAYEHAKDGGYEGTEEEFAAETANAAVKVKEQGEQISILDKRITNIEKGYPSDPFVERSGMASRIAVPSGVLPFAELISIGGTANTIKSVHSNFLLNFELADNSFFIKKVDDGLGLSVSGSLYSDYNVEMVGKLPAGTYNFSWTPDKAIEEHFEVVLCTENNGGVGYNPLTSPFTLASETTLYLCMTSSPAGVSGVTVYPVIAEANGAYLEIDSYSIPEEIITMDGWTVRASVLNFKDGTFYNFKTKTYTDVRDIVGYDNYIKVASGGTLLFLATDDKTVNYGIVFATKVLGGNS